MAPKIGYKHTKEALQKIKEAGKKRWANKERRAVQRETLKRAYAQSEVRESHRQKMLLVNGTEEKRKKTGEVTRELWKNPEYRAKQAKFLSPERRSKTAKELWQRAEFVQAQMKARGVRPNKLELQAADILKPLGFTYVGDGTLIIGGKCPDFWDGNLELVEIYGDYWHRGQDPQDRIDHFAKHGYKCQVIWEHELQELVN